MSDILPVVTIETPNGPVEINERDFDPSIHKLFGGKSFEDMSATELRAYAENNGIDVKGLKSKVDLLNAINKADPKNETYVVPTTDGKFTIVNAEGNPTTDQVFDTQEEAEKAMG